MAFAHGSRGKDIGTPKPWPPSDHFDHLDIATLTQLRHRFAPIVLAAAGDGRIVGPLGFKDVRELDWWEEIEFNDTLKVTFVPAQHFSARGLFDRQQSLWGGYMI